MTDEDYLEHYGTPRHSGRYPWGSGKNPYQRTASFLAYVSDLRSKGMTDAEIAKGMGMNSKQLRAKYSIAKDEKRMADAAEVWRLYEKGYSKTAIGKRMGINESTVRSLMDPSIQKRSEATFETANMLQKNVDDRGFIDIGSGTEQYMGVSRTKLNTAVSLLEEKGYVTHNVNVEQLGTGKQTTIKVLCPPGTKWAEVQNNKDKIQSIIGWSDDGGQTFETPKPPVSISKDRVMVRYGNDGGKDKDGVIELRRGVDDISLGNSSYAQVRIAVGDTHYLKGMAVYSDNMPKGVDIIFNTNKNSDTPIYGSKDNSILKPLKTKNGEINIEDPFGATIRRQQTYIDSDGKTKRSVINIVNEEGDWSNWNKALASQVLSKQSPALAKKQLALKYDSMVSEYEEINSLTNPTVKKKLMMEFSDKCDAAAVHLDAAAMPRQSTHVLLPLTSIKETEIYAPRYKDGEQVILIRYPHGGKFEIPSLTVNNRNKEGQSVITKKSPDAVGIHHKVAEQLSGADFDGDTVLVIPNKSGPMSIKTQSPLKELKDFDPKTSYPGYEGMKKMTSREKGIEMGKVSNLITDMTIHGAPNSEIARAVRHSMVVIDAEKHGLNYKQSYIDNGIAELNKKYQGKSSGGAATLISRASGETHPYTRTEKIDPKTGKKIYTTKPHDVYNKVTINANGDKVVKEVRRKINSTKMYETDDAFKLVSGGSRSKTTDIEIVYAEHANRLKSLANDARKIAVNTKAPKVSQSAKETYKAEVASLKSKLNDALKNAPLERQAQLVANTELKAIRQANPDMSKDDIKKEKGKALERARKRVGANKKKVLVDIEEREWEAIQSHAINKTTLEKILNNSNPDKIRQLATPKESIGMTSSRISRAKSMLNAGCTLAEVSEALGVSVSTITKAING